MGFFNFGKQKSAGDWSQQLLSIMAASGRPARRGTTEMLLAYRLSPWLHSVVRRIAEEFATTLEFELYDRPLTDPARKQIHEHRILDVLNNPHPMLDSYAIRKIYQTHKDIAGNAFLVIDRDLLGRPARLTPVIPTQIISLPTVNRPFYQISTAEGVRELAVADILHFPDHDPADIFGMGIGTAESLADEISTDENAAKNINAFFFNGMMPDILVSLSGADEKALKMAAEDFKQKYGGAKKSHRVHFTGKTMNVQRIDTSFKDMDLVSIREFERNTIIQNFNVPPEVVGIVENSNRATAEAAYYIFAKGCLFPRMKSFVSALQLKLVPQFGEKVYLGFKNPIPENTDLQLRAISVAPQAFTVGEIRQIAGLVPGDDADKPLSSAAEYSGSTDPHAQEPTPAGPTNLPSGK